MDAIGQHFIISPKMGAASAALAEFLDSGLASGQRRRLGSQVHDPCSTGGYMYWSH